MTAKRQLIHRERLLDQRGPRRQRRQRSEEKGGGDDDEEKEQEEEAEDEEEEEAVEDRHQRLRYEWWSMGRQQWLGRGRFGRSWSSKTSHQMFFEANLRSGGRAAYFKEGWGSSLATGTVHSSSSSSSSSSRQLRKSLTIGGSDNENDDDDDSSSSSGGGGGGGDRRSRSAGESVRDRAIARLWVDALDRSRVTAEAAAAAAAARAFFGGGGGGGGWLSGGGSVVGGATAPPSASAAALGELRETRLLSNGGTIQVRRSFGSCQRRQYARNPNIPNTETLIGVCLCLLYY